MKPLQLFGTMLLSAALASAADCDRACLKNTMTTYLNALAAKDPSKAPLATGCRRHLYLSRPLVRGPVSFDAKWVASVA